MVAIQLALKNVYRKRERSFLTIVGVLLAIASFVSLLSIAEGLYQKVSREVLGRNVDIYVLPSDAASLPTGPIGTIGFSTEVLPVEYIEKITDEYDGIEICPIYRIQEKMGNETITVLGIETEKFTTFFPYFQLQGGGRLFLGTSNEVVVGGQLARQKNINLQRPVGIDGMPFEVVGIGMPIDTFQDYFCFINLPNAMELKNAKGYHEIWIQIPGRHRNDRAQFAQKLRKDYPNLNIKTREEYLGSANEYVNYAWLLQFAIAAIGILIATTAAMNTMLMSTYERIKEFGTLRSIGASRFTVCSMILMESMILTSFGGLGGILLGILGSKVLDAAFKALMQLSFPMAGITSSLILYAVILSFFIGVIGAVIPAIIVYKMDIIDALRWE